MVKRTRNYTQTDGILAVIPKSFGLFIVIAVTLAAAGGAATTIYTWTDADGVVHMTNIPPVVPEKNLETLKLKPAPPESEPQIQYSQPQEEPGPETETAIEIVDNHVIVPVELFYENRKVAANLLLDTGSSNIMLHDDVAKKLKIGRSQKGSVRVAGGEVIDAEAFRLDAVRVGPHSKRDLMAGVIEHHGADVPFDGLLGMNFLKDYSYSIDFDKKVLRWHE